MNMEHFFPNKEQFDTMNVLLAAIASNSGGIKVESWRDVQSIVRLGLADKVFSIGDQLVCNKGDQQLVWDIIGFDHDVPADPQYKHSMTLQLHDALPNAMQFDGEEALFYCETELVAGTYNFTLIADFDTDYGGGKTYQFTLTTAVPADGVIVFHWKDKVDAIKSLIATYENITATEAIESVGVTEGEGGTDLETIGGGCNHTRRVKAGSNNWEQSAIRQFLNSKGAAGTYWTPQTKFDRHPAWNADTAGFLSDLDEDFQEVIGEVTKRTALDTEVDGGGYKDLTERFFLLARGEAYAKDQNEINEGAPYEYYSLGSDLSNEATTADSNRIKYQKGSSISWWIRSSEAKLCSHPRIILKDGSLGSARACNAQGIAPVCNVI